MTLQLWLKTVAYSLACCINLVNCALETLFKKLSRRYEISQTNSQGADVNLYSYLDRTTVSEGILLSILSS